MSKPIIIVYYFPDLLTKAGGKLLPIYEVNKMFIDKFPDYHVLAIPSHLSIDGSCEDVRLEVFHEKDITEVTFQELKDHVLATIEQQKQTP